ncbi:cytochrome P450 [Streptomyces sp. R302]|uniref:cytochrome P450 n=1 Tax=unclassified Streptomyces TaxID=2593676 RepID=UPI00145E6B30|nr:MULTISPECIES: cytochrome P450 [unclassified Streptomyces]NML53642.1 cytochrome P450 [Streptomyces sp. R301]NML82003.1 cytochrome P450 [Streptomyces sp. R302]
MSSSDRQNSAEPPGLPAILEGFDLTDHAGFADGIPYGLFARLRAEAPVLRHPAGTLPDGEGFWVLTRHADIAAASVDPVYSSQGGGGRRGGGSHLEDLPFGGGLTGSVLAMMDNPRHDVFKHLLGPALATGVTRLEPELRALAAELADRAVARGRVNLVDDYTEPFSLRSVALLLGVPRADWPELEERVHAVLGFTHRATGRVDEASKAVYAGLRSSFTDLLKRKRKRPGDDLTSVLATGELPADSGQPPLTDLERETNASVLLVSGFEQPRNTIAGGLLAFAHHPDQWRELRKDRSLLPTAVEEVLRWLPANPYNRRTLTRDVELHGHLMRAGDKVTLWWPSANRDETVFPDPDRFDIRRDPNPHLSFGHGVHYCLGDSFGRLEIRLALEALLDRVEEIRPAGPEIWAPNNKHTVLLDVPAELVPAELVPEEGTR